MICISLSPPYATLIALLLKRIETRSWATTHRGTLAIHQTAAPGPRGTTEAALWDLCLSEPFRAVLSIGPHLLPRGKIVAVVDLVDCVMTDSLTILKTYAEMLPNHSARVWRLTDQERAFGNYSPGRYGWLLDNVRALPEPVSARGLPGLWRCDAATAAAVEMQIGVLT